MRSVDTTSKIGRRESASGASDFVCRIAILGGGISGLTALYALARARREGAPIEPFLIEASPRPGGVIQTERIENFTFECGPDSFLTEKPEAAALAEELGLGGQLTGSNDVRRRTYILHRNRLVPLPEGLVLFIPARVGSVLRSPLLPFSSRLAIVRDYFRRPVKRRHDTDDEPVAQMVRRHFGAGMLENIAAPLLEGVYGGDSERLSARSVLPRFCALEKQYGSLARGILKSRAQKPASRPLFTTLRGGLDQLVHKLVEKASTEGGAGRMLLGTRVAALEAGASARGPIAYSIHCDNGQSVSADALILALPAFECGRVLNGIRPSLATELAAIPYTSAVTVSLAYRLRPASLPEGFGFLVPRTAGCPLLACTFVHDKFPFRAPAESASLRCFLGGARDPEVVELDSEALCSLAIRELRRILGIAEPPLFSTVYRWPRAMPQYVVGHEERVGRIRSEIAKTAGLFLAGSAYSGVGISDCIRSARAAAAQSVEFAVAR